MEEPAPEGAAEAPVSPAAPESSGQSDAPALSREERALLDDLLAGRPPQSASPDLLVDSINEKLLDLVGDTVLEFDDTGAPSLVEDYLDDVRAMM